MRNKFFLVLFFLFVGISPLFAAELSGTYNKNYTVKTEFNTISKGKTLRVTNGSTFTMTDAIVHGNIVVDKGSSLVAAKDGAGYLVFKQGTSVKGIDLYYKVRVSDDLVFTRKLPMTLDEVWKSGNQELIEWVGNIEFCYSSSLKGWVSINEIRFMNPFNENLYDNYDMVFTKSVSKVLETECRSLIVKNNSQVVILPKKDVFGTKVNESIIIESGSSLLGTGPDGHKLVLKKGIKIEGLPLYIRNNNTLVAADTITSDLWSLPALSENDYYTIAYKPELKGWFFEDVIVNGNDINPKEAVKEISYDTYDMVFTESVSKIIENECRSLTVKNKAQVVVLPNKDVWGTKINKSITIKSGSSLLGTDPDGHKLQLKKGIKIKGLPLYVRFNNELIAANSILSDLWKLPAFNQNDYVAVYYKPELQGWVFQDIIISEGDLSKSLKKKIDKLKKK